ncbi:hypothetical protein DUNSADRAFT_11015 [Dunaliella salina]|uniref:Encoded protein n=1 Tax=Dunaliella salina TaxID=3046 RepID=A0ABQ7GE97_DUNSA|nr:hypothetical protein DUNSADRAFT_11015 [Dunaliella salina]|eukprot:KAF5832935.1 hypothetical protein DUNSADRAFT_11015 [Dunaliella salina]
MRALDLHRLLPCADPLPPVPREEPACQAPACVPVMKPPPSGCAIAAVACPSQEKRDGCLKRGGFSSQSCNGHNREHLDAYKEWVAAGMEVDSAAARAARELMSMCLSVPRNTSGVVFGTEVAAARAAMDVMSARRVPLSISRVAVETGLDSAAARAARRELMSVRLRVLHNASGVV